MSFFGSLALMVVSIFVFFGVVISTQETVLMFKDMLMEIKNFRAIKNNTVDIDLRDYESGVLYARKSLKSAVDYFVLSISICLAFWIIAIVIAKSIIAMY